MLFHITRKVQPTSVNLDLRFNHKKVTIKPNESPEDLLRRFRKKVMRSGNLAAVRQKRWFVSKSEMRRIEKKKAIRRLRQRRRRPY